MKIKILFLLLILIITFTSNLKAHSPIDTSFLFVYAKSGLKLRSEPNLKSETLALVKYSEAVKPIKVIDAFYSRIEDRRGKWLEVNYQGQIGYMFSGFLSKLPRASSFISYSNEGLDRKMSLYFSTVLFQTSKKDTMELKGCEGDIPPCKSRVIKISYKMNRGFQTNEYEKYDYFPKEIIGNWLFEDALDLVESILGSSLVEKFKIKNEDGFVKFIHDSPNWISHITVQKINDFQTMISYSGS